MSYRAPMVEGEACGALGLAFIEEIRHSRDAMAKTRKTIALGARGRVGESHPRACLTDAQVDLIRDLREERGFSYGLLAWMFQVAKSTVQGLCDYRRRNTTPTRYVSVVDNPREDG